MYKINIHQGNFSYYRGFNALCYKLTLQYAAKFAVFNDFEHKFGTHTAALISATAITALTYPLDIAQARMAGDMSKKPSLFV